MITIIPKQTTYTMRLTIYLFASMLLLSLNTVTAQGLDCLAEGVDITVESGNFSQGATQTGSISNGSLSTNYTLTNTLLQGYASYTLSPIKNGRNGSGLQIQMNSSGESPDANTFVFTMDNTSAGYVTRVRLYQVLDRSGGNNEASDYTVSWTGGEGNARFFDPLVNGGVYEFGFPPGFDIENGEIEGLGKSGEITNGGTFRVYMVKNNLTQWHIEFPLGATDITVNKVVLTGATVINLAADDELRNDPASGIDAEFPRYGRVTGASGESFNEWISFQTFFEPTLGCLAVSNPTVNEGSDWAVFEVTGAAGQPLMLSVDQGTGEGFAELGDTPAIEFWDGSEWVAYTAGDQVAIPATGPLYVRVGITNEQDDEFEGAETFVLVATNASGTPAEGTGTIIDDGTGDYWIGDALTAATPAELLTAGIILDDDRPLQVNDVTVNEGSDWAVFEVTGAAGQPLMLSVDQGTGEGFAELGANPALEVWDGNAWVSYTGSAEIPATGPLYVRVDITEEQDDEFEGAETFVLVATNTGGTPAEGTGTIIDDGTGDYWIGDALTAATPEELADAGIILDDDCVNSLIFLENFEAATVNPYASAPIYQPGVSLNGQLKEDGANGTNQSLFYNTGVGTYRVGDVFWGTKTPITVSQNSTYEISYYMQAPNGISPPRVETWVNNVKIGNATTITTSWIKYTFTWNSGSSTTLDLSLRNLTDTGTGNDFYLDEIEVIAICIDVDTDNDRALQVNSPVVNEGSDWAVFEVSGPAGHSLTLAVNQGSGDGFADLGATSAIEYWNGSAWTSYTTGTVAIPATGPLYVRVNIEAEQDDEFEGAETFVLMATNASGTPAEGTGTIVDDGTGDYWIGDAFTAATPAELLTAGIILDDDRPLEVSDVMVNEASDWAVFEVSGADSALIILSLNQGSGDGFADLGAAPAIEYWDGTEWVSYTLGDQVAIPFNGPLYVRVDITEEQDDEFEGAETFVLVATNTGGTPAEGTGTIIDDGTGDYWIGDALTAATPAELLTAGIILDDDRPLQVNDVTVNEGSDWAVFEVTGAAGQSLMLSVDQGTGEGFAELGATPALEVWDGNAWVSYTGSAEIPATGPLYVRVNIEAEQDDEFEGAETFVLMATNASGTPAEGTGTIIDDGTGDYWIGDALTAATPAELLTAGIILDDDRPLQVNDVTVNEGSDWAVFEVTGAAGQSLMLSVDQGTGEGFAELGATPALEVWDGNAWVSYTGSAEIPATGPLYVRVNIEAEQDDEFEGAETFVLVATNASGTPAEGTGTIIDDGTGDYWIGDALTAATPAELLTAGIILDDDRPLQVNDVTVNEGSDWAVFEVTGAAGQSLMLSVDQGTGEGFAELGATPALEVWDGNAWVSYTGSAEIPATGPLYVRVDITEEQDDEFEGAETFVLVATNASGTPAEGTGTIIDDGTGDYWIGDALTAATPAELLTAGIILDDDRIVETPPATPDVNATFVNQIIRGSVNTNDIVKGGVYSFDSENPANKAGSEISIFEDGSYEFTAPEPGVYIYFVLVDFSNQDENSLGAELAESSLILSASQDPIVTSALKTQLTITVLDPDGLDNPPIVNTDIAATRVNQPVKVNSLLNDRPGSPGRSLDPASVSIVNEPFNGTTVVDFITGEITYTPNQGFAGEDFYSYKVCDDNTPSQCGEGLQLITVYPTTAPNTTLAADDFAYTYSNRPVFGNVLLNDIDPEGDMMTAKPMRVDAEEGILELKDDGSFIFTPAFGYAGQYEAIYEMCDDGEPVACANATLYVLVNRQLSNADVHAGYVGIALNGDVSTNDKVLPITFYGEPIADFQNPEGASITLNASGSYIFQAPLSGKYVYNVPVCTDFENDIYCSETALTITIVDPESSNPAPFAQTDVAQTLINTPVTINTLSNDQPGRPGLSLDVSSVRVIESPEKGEVTLDKETGNITYTPGAGFTGIDKLLYEVCDNNSPAACSSAYQMIAVLSPSSFNNTLASDDFYLLAPGDNIIRGNLLVNDIDMQSDIQQAVAQTIQNIAGEFSLQEDGEFTFTPDHGFTGTARFAYTVCDDGTPVACASATLYILVSPPIEKNLFEVSGNGQQYFVNQSLPLPLVTEIVNQYGDRVAFIDITYTILSVPDKTQSITLIDPETEQQATGINATITVQTDAEGKGYVNVILPDKPGDVIIEASSPGLQTIEFVLSAIPDKFEIEQNYPNPLRNSTIIPIYLPESAITSIQIYDIEGKLVDLPLADQLLDAGLHNITWNASRFASGVYIYRVIARGESGKSYSKTLRLTVIK
jgi:hypothetical protein